MTKFGQNYPVVLSSRAVFVRNKLLELTIAKNHQEVLQNALRLHTTAIRGHKNRSNLFSSRDGKTPFPIHLLAPETQVQLPPEADALEPVRFEVAINTESTAEGFGELMAFAETEDASAVIENAFFFHYGLIQRENQGEQFFVRDHKTRKLRPVSLFASKSGDDEEGPDGPAA